MYSCAITNAEADRKTETHRDREREIKFGLSWHLRWSMDMLALLLILLLLVLVVLVLLSFNLVCLTQQSASVQSRVSVTLMEFNFPSGSPTLQLFSSDARNSQTHAM